MSKSAFAFKSKFPTIKEWTKAFRSKTAVALPRATLSNYQMAEKGVKALNIQNPSNMTAVEIYPGLGLWTTAMKNIGFKRILTLEPQPFYRNWMKEQFSNESEGVVEVLKKDGYDWDTYVELKTSEYIGDLENQDWSQMHPNLLFTGTIPKGSKGEQLLAQFSSCIVNKMAMHSLGRVQMIFWVPDALYKKFVAPPGDHIRCKMSIIAEACAEVEVIQKTDPTDLYPNSEYYLVSVKPFEKKKLKSQWDVFEYVLKHLFVMQKKPLKHMVK
ncbi:ribosomal RNA adenine methyltransferase KsgA/Erm [Pilobolus umbonatus]|nr:ribosomal RNA adenine methyltransferase KsgA/Erm [Pilobolus umbonatus]